MPENHFPPLPTTNVGEAGVQRGGKFIDIEVYGTAYIGGTATLGGDIVMGAGGSLRTAESGQRIEITNAERNFINFYSGDADELAAGYISEVVNGSGDTRTIQFGMYTPQLEQTTDTQVDAIGNFVVRSGSPDGSSFAPAFVFSQATAASGGGQSLEVRIQNSIPVITDGDVTLSAGDIRLAVDSEIGWGSSYDDAIYSDTDSELKVKIAGTDKLAIGASLLSGSLLEWQTWSPTVVNLTVGNGTTVARYARVGDIVHLYYEFILGSTSSVGSGVRVEYPVTPRDEPTGAGQLQDTGSVFYPCTVYHSASDMKLGAHTASGSYAQISQVTSTVPFTWTTGDRIVFNITYEAA